VAIHNHHVPNRGGHDRPARAHPLPRQAPTLDPLLTPPPEEGYPCESLWKSSYLISCEAAWLPLISHARRRSRADGEAVVSEARGLSSGAIRSPSGEGGVLYTVGAGFQPQGRSS
jgi:hypothetical protein